MFGFQKINHVKKLSFQLFVPKVIYGMMLLKFVKPQPKKNAHQIFIIMLILNNAKPLFMNQVVQMVSS